MGNKETRFLLINPSQSVSVYRKSKLKAALSEIPLLSLAVLGAMLEKNGIKPKILDLSVSENPAQDLEKTIKEFSPQFAGITFTTPLAYEAKEIAKKIKEINPKITIIAGGVHSSAMPLEVINRSCFDIAVWGEGDETIVEIAKGKELAKIKGIAYRKGHKPVITPKRELIENLDSLPFPAWHLYDLSKYKTSRLTSRKSPVGAIATSRGCVFNCSYCNKSVFGRKFRYMSPERVVDEMEHTLKCGFKEIHIWDDNFSTIIDRAKKICDIIIERKLNFPWCLETGIRVDCADQEFFDKAKKAGCYAVYMGVESGDDEILKRIGKEITTDMVRRTFKMAKKAGMETVGFFMIGLPGETIEKMEKTIKFATELEMDYAKVTITVPFPATRLFEELDKKGLIKTRDWRKYNFHTPAKVYTHENLDWDTLDKYYHKFYRKFYFRPKYLAKRIGNGILTGRIFWDFYYFVKTWIV